jgi:hypothetical protein
MPRHSSPRRRQKSDIAEVVTVTAPEPAVAKAKVRGATLFAEQLGELELVRTGLAAAGDDAKIIHTLQVRGDAALREMAGKAKLPGWCSKSMRMQWRRAAAQPEAKAPRAKKPRKLTPAPTPVHKKSGPWIEGADGTLSREIISQ